MTPMLLLLSLGCKQDQNFAERGYDMIAVVSGDFDVVESNLNRLLVPYQLYEGFISGPAYDEGPDPDAISLKSETLFTGVTEDGGRELFLFDAVFVNSGTRGFGEYVYNGLETDDDIVTDQDAIANIREYVERGGVLVVSDWAYELIEAAWPDRLEFFGEDSAFDEAQAGSVGRYTARVESDAAREALGGDEASIAYDFSYWSIIETVGEGVDVHLSADVLFRVSNEDGEGTMPGSPLLVSFEEGNGLVVYSTFHWSNQPASLADPLMTALIEGLPIDGATDDDSTEETSGE